MCGLRYAYRLWQLHQGRCASEKQQTGSSLVQCNFPLTVLCVSVCGKSSVSVQISDMKME